MRVGFNKYWAMPGASHSMLVLLSNVMRTCWTTFSKRFGITIWLGILDVFLLQCVYPHDEWMNETKCDWGCFVIMALGHQVMNLKVVYSYPKNCVGSFCTTLSCILWNQSKVCKSYSLICVCFKLKILILRCKKRILYVWSLNQGILKILRKG